MEVTLKGAPELQRALKSHQANAIKALQTALKVEAFRLSKELKAEIRAGDRFAPLTFLARRRNKSTRPNRPLQRLAIPIRYHMVDDMTVAIGWTGPKVSASWKRIAQRQQEGFTSQVTERRRRFFRHKADNLSERSANRKFLFLRDTTRALKTPARPIIDPFYERHHIQAWRNIQANFRRKLAGERI
ncbi:hypothetical protein [Desulfatitalea tepidiphila]|uniref:hypothetical protein n=1 Tax=Desulfatitalea tepidiphila TaxID=1185843 RepID=UPI0006B6885A|nr:hypothetical protein [Desulfatitalea tepidiphila]